MFQAYIVRCLSTQKCYIGITAQTLAKRWSQHVSNASNRPMKTALYGAILEHGAKGFEIWQIASCRSWADVCAVEIELIRQWGTIVPGGYNLTAGGSAFTGFKRSAESIERSAAKHRGKPCHPNTRAAGIRTHLNKPKPSDQRAKIAASKRGIPRSEATKEKLAAYWQKRRADGQFKTSTPYEHAAAVKQPQR